MRNFQYVVIAAGLFLLPNSAAAWECEYWGCPKQCDAMLTYAIGDLPTGVDEVEAVAEIQRAFDAWNAPTCHDFGFQYLGRVGEFSGPVSILVGVVPWTPDLGGPTTWALSASIIASAGCYAAASPPAPNLMLNDDNHTWTTDGTADFMSTVDLYSAVIGRIGGLLGIGNADDPNTVVRPFLSSSITTGILSSDEDAICYLYADGTVEPDNLMPPNLDGCLCTSAADCAPGESCLEVLGSMICVEECEGLGSCEGENECFQMSGPSEPGVCVGVELDFTPTCPVPYDSPDMGTTEPDVGVTPDMGAPDMGAPDTGAESDMGGPAAMTNSDDSKGCGCGTAGSVPFSPLLLLLVAMVGFFRRVRRA